VRQIAGKWQCIYCVFDDHRPIGLLTDADPGFNKLRWILWTCHSWPISLSQKHIR
jgi:hypothetical protein